MLRAETEIKNAKLEKGETIQDVQEGADLQEAASHGSAQQQEEGNTKAASQEPPQQQEEGDTEADSKGPAQQQEKGCGKEASPPKTIEDLVNLANEAIRNGAIKKYSNLQNKNSQILYVIKYKNRVAICYNNKGVFEKCKDINELKVRDFCQESSSYVTGSDENEIVNNIRALDLKQINEKSLCEQLGVESCKKELAKENSIKVIGNREKKYSNLQNEDDKILYVIEYNNKVVICYNNSCDFKEYKGNDTKLFEKSIQSGSPLYVAGGYNEHRIEDKIRKLDLESNEINKKSLYKCLGLKGFRKGIKDYFNKYREFYTNVDNSSKKDTVFYFGKGSKMVVLDTNKDVTVGFKESKKEDISKYKCVSFEKMYDAGKTESYVNIYEKLKSLNDASKQFVDKVAELLEIKSICEDVSAEKVKYIFHNEDKYLYIDNKGKYNTKQLPKLSGKRLDGIESTSISNYADLYLKVISVKNIVKKASKDISVCSQLSEVLGLTLNITEEDLSDWDNIVVRTGEGVSLEELEPNIYFIRVAKEKVGSNAKKLICVTKDESILDKPERIEKGEKFDKYDYFNIFNLAKKVSKGDDDEIAINYEAIEKGEIYEISYGKKAVYVSGGKCISGLSEAEKKYISSECKGEIEIDNYEDYYKEVYDDGKGIVTDYEEERNILSSLELESNAIRMESYQMYIENGVFSSTNNKFTIQFDDSVSDKFVLVVKEDTDFSRLGRNIRKLKSEELSDQQKRIINLAKEEKNPNIGFSDKVSYEALTEQEKERLDNMIEFIVIPTQKIRINKDEKLLLIRDNFKIIQDSLLIPIKKFNFDQLAQGKCLDLSNISELEKEIFKRAEQRFKENKIINYKILINGNQSSLILKEIDLKQWEKIKDDNKIEIKYDNKPLIDINEIVIEGKDGKPVVIEIDTVEKLKNNYKKIVFTISNYKKEMKFYEINVEKLGEKYLYIKQVEPKKGTKNLIYKDQEKVGNLVVKTLERIKYSENPEIVKGIMAKWTINEIEREILLKESGVLEIELGDGLEEIINRIENIAREVSAQTYEAK